MTIKKKQVDDVYDETDRRILCAAIAANSVERLALESREGKIWDTTELQRDFVVHGFLAPFVRVTRKSDKSKGSMLFQHHPRFYYGFKADK
jgi:hypothetical protein